MKVFKVLFRDLGLLSCAIAIIALSTSLWGAIVVALILILTVLTICFKENFRALNKRSVVTLGVFYLIVIIYAMLGRGTLSSVSFKTQLYAIILMISSFIMSGYLEKLDRRTIEPLLYIALFSLFFSIVVSTFVSLVNPMAIRSYGFGDAANYYLTDSEGIRFRGLMSYSMSHTMPICAMGLCLLILSAQKKWIKILSAVFLVVLVRLLFVMTITTAFLLTVVGIAFILVDGVTHGSVVGTIGIVTVLLLVFFLTGLAVIFLDFSGSSNAQISLKLSDLFSSIQNGSSVGQFAYRLDLYKSSINTFLSNPFFGWGKDNGSRTIIGEHSFLFDYLAYYGFFALLLFTAWWREYKLFSKRLPDRYKKAYFYFFIPVVSLYIFKAASVCILLPFMSLVFTKLIFLFILEDSSTALSKKH